MRWPGLMLLLFLGACGFCDSFPVDSQARTVARARELVLASDLVLTAAGVACLFSPYTLLVGIVLLALSVFGTFLLPLIPRSAAHAYRNTPYLHDALTYGVDDRGPWLAGPLLEARVPWAAAYLWDARDGWLRISAHGAPHFWFPVAALKEVGVHEPVMALCKRHAVRFNSPEARAGRR